MDSKAASLRTPRLTALLDKSKSTGHSTHSSKPTHPPISSPQALVSRPPYRPTSTADFLARLGTFKLTTYRDKPRVIDAVVAARCGWKNDGVDRLVCDYCLATWIVASTTDMSREAGERLGTCFIVLWLISSLNASTYAHRTTSCCHDILPQRLVPLAHTTM